MDNKQILNRIEEVMATLATEVSEADFMLTHMPFRRLVDYINNSKSIDDNLYINELRFDEEKLLEDIEYEYKSRHQFIIVQGTNGSGKSHLIRWLYYQYNKFIKANKDEANEVIVFIPRYHNSVLLAITEILNKDVLSKERKKKYLDKINAGNVSLSDEEKLENIYNILKSTVHHDEKCSYLSPFDRIGLYSFLSDNGIMQAVFLKDDGPIERICKKLNSSIDEMDEDERPVFSDEDLLIEYEVMNDLLMSANHKDAEAYSFADYLQNDFNLRHEVVEYLNSLVSEIVKKSLTFNGNDVKTVFEEIRSELYRSGKRLSLFIEDITAFSGIDNELIEILIDKALPGEEKCRIMSVVGTTDKYFQNHMPENINDRTTKNVVIMNNALFDDGKLLNVNCMAEFAARYINAIHLSNDEVSTWYAGADISDVPVWKSDYRFGDVDVDGKTMSIFPFNKNSLLNLYSCFSDTNKTPRKFLKDIVKHVEIAWCKKKENIINTETSFYNASISKLGLIPGYIENQTGLLEEKVRLKFEALYLVWGDHSKSDADKNCLWGIDDEIFELFKLDKNCIIGGASNVTPPIIEPVDPVDPVDPVVDQEYKSFQDTIEHVKLWANGSEKEFVYHKTVRALIGNYLLKSINWEYENIPYSFAVSFCKSLTNISIEGQSAETNSAIILEINNQSRDFIQALLSQNYYSKKSNSNGWNYSSGSLHEIYCRTWLVSHKDDIVKAIKNSIIDDDISKVCVESMIDLKHFCGKIASNNEADIINAIVNYRIETEDYSEMSNSKWNASLTNMITKAGDIEKLFAECYRTAVGSAKISLETVYTFIDAARLIDDYKEVLANNSTKNWSKLKSKDIDARLIPCIDVINEYRRNIEDCLTERYTQVESAVKELSSYFGKPISQETIVKTIRKMDDYLHFLKVDANKFLDKRYYSIVNEDLAVEIYQLSEKCKSISTEKDKENRKFIASSIDADRLKYYLKELSFFKQLIDDTTNSFNSSLDSEIDSKIEEKKKELFELIDAHEGGANAD